MSGRVVLCCAALAACGRIGFDDVGGGGGGGDGGGDDGGGSNTSAVPSVVQTAATSGFVSTLDVPLALTTPGTLIVVATTSFSIGDAVGSVTDDANDVYVSANALSTWNQPPLHFVEVWYSASGFGGAQTLHVIAPMNSTREAWILELANMDLANPVETVGTIDDEVHSDPQAPVVMPTTSSAAIISVTDIGGAVEQLVATSVFTPMMSQSTNNAAYYIATAPGAYGAQWLDPNSDSYAASTVAFAPAP